MNKTWISAFGFITLMLTAAVWAAPVPDTGQSKCYNNTNEIPCPSPGQPFYGQDAHYSINSMSYTKLDGSGNALPDSAVSWVMVLDNITGLIWEVKTTDGTINDIGKTYTWYDPAYPYLGSQGNGKDTKYFIDAMNIAQFGGSRDWRMPTIKELGTLIDYNIVGLEPALNGDYFPNTFATLYWSSTAYVFSTFNAWGVTFSSGFDYFLHKDRFNSARAVREGQSGSLGNLAIGSFDALASGSLDDAQTAAGGYADNGDGTVIDKSTGMMWQQVGPSTVMTWEQALAYCEGLDLAGYKDWRLPSKKVLRSLVDFTRVNPSINTTYFFEPPYYFVNGPPFYWSSTTDVHLMAFAWGAYFDVGDDGFTKKLGDGYVRAVRGGQVPSPTGCTTTIDKNLLLHIPYISYIHPLLGKISLWADLIYEFNPDYPTLIFFKLTNTGMINNPSYLCSSSTLSDVFKLHIPDVLFPDGSTHLWVDLEYSAAHSTDVNSTFVVTNGGPVSN